MDFDLTVNEIRLILSWLYSIKPEHKLAKVGIKSCKFAMECVSFVHAWM